MFRENVYVVHCNKSILVYTQIDSLMVLASSSKNAEIYITSAFPWGVAARQRAVAENSPTSSDHNTATT